MCKVIVCGGRDFTDRDFIFAKLDELHKARKFTKLVHGGARGVDSIAGEWAGRQPGMSVAVYRADWATHGRAAGPIRNLEMLEAERPDLVVAFPGGRGTAHMIGAALDSCAQTVVFRKYA